MKTFVLASTEFVLLTNSLVGIFPNPNKERNDYLMRARNIKINVFLNEEEKEMLIDKSKKSGLSQSDFIRNLIQRYYQFQPTKKEQEEMINSLSKIVENLDLLKNQMDFLCYTDYSKFITTQITVINNIIRK